MTLSDYVRTEVCGVVDTKYVNKRKKEIRINDFGVCRQ